LTAPDSGMSVGVFRSHSWKFVGGYALKPLQRSLRFPMHATLLATAVNRFWKRFSARTTTHGVRRRNGYL